MPPVDLSALKNAQTQAARSRLALDKANDAVNAARAEMQLQQKVLETAQRKGDARAVQRAVAAIEKAQTGLVDRQRQREELSAKLAEKLKDFLKFGIDAPADVPLLLMPLRLETRFGKLADGRNVLRVRIYPDDIHMDHSHPGGSAEELAAGRAYWSALFQAPDDSGIDAPWAQLKSVAGRDRVRHVALATRPANPAQRGTGAAPVFPDPPVLERSAARPRLMPERFRLTAWQGGQQLRAQGGQVDHDLRVGLLAEDGSQMQDHDGLRLLEGTGWLGDYDLALKKGMAIELPLPRLAPVETLFVYGICQGRQSSDGAAAVQDLLAAHDGAGRLAFVAQGVPTNNTEEDDAGWQRRDEPAPVPLTPPVALADANAAVTAAALGMDPGQLAGLRGGELREQGLAGAMNAALWPATWGYFLETLDAGQQALSPWVIEEARKFHQVSLRGRGALPALRVGQQPYGILPFAGFSRRFSATDGGQVEKGIEALARKAMPVWQGGVGNVPVLDQGADAARVMEIFGHAPQSWGVRARKCLSRNFLDTVQATTDQARPAAEVEGLLNTLLAETMGNMSLVYGAGSLDDESRPVALPYADAARDADYLQALLDGRSPGAISSVFQALVSLGWAHTKAAATPTRRLSEAVQATATLRVDQAQRIVALAVREDGPGASRADYDAILSEIRPATTDSTRAPTLRFVTMAEDPAELVLKSTSVVERDRLGMALVEVLLGAKARMTDLRNALTTLVDIARQQPGGGDFTQAVAEVLDCASHRLDAWVLALSWARFGRIRKAKPAGLSVGAYGWLFDIRPQARAARNGGFVAAPTLEQATTAGMLRSGWLAHGSGSAFAVNLSSRRVRLAQELLEGVANGQPVGALLGYRFERHLNDHACERFVLSFRGIAPLSAGMLNSAENPANDSESPVAAEVNVTDMLKLLEIWNNPAKGPAWVFTELARRPEHNEYLDDNVDWEPPSAAQKTAITRAVTDVAADADALADLLLAEAVHQLGQGNMARASAVLDAGGRGEAPPPPEPDVVNSHGPGTIVSHRLIAVPDAARGWSVISPRAQVSPVTEGWAAGLLPDPVRVVLGQAAGGGRATLADTGMSALDFAAACRHPDLLSRLVRARADLANPDAAFPEGGAELGPNGISLSEAALTGAALQEVLDRAVPLDGDNIGLPGATGWQPVEGALVAAQQRLIQVAGLLSARLQGLADLLAAPMVARDELLQSLLSLTDFGIELPGISEAQTGDVAMLALREGDDRLKRLSSLLAAPPSVAKLAEAAEALFGAGLPLPVPHVFAPGLPEDPTLPVEILGDRPMSPVAPGAVQRYMADMGSVRAAVGSFNRLTLLASINGTPPTLTLRQLCGIGDNPPDDWIGEGLRIDQTSPSCPVVSVAADAPAGLDLTAPIAGLLIDEWTETMPLRQPFGEGGPVGSHATAGVAIHADAPAAEPPQTLLLALSPDRQRWTEDSLCDFLADTIELAKARLVTLETLPLAPRILPAIYTQSWSLQGEAVIDWSKIKLQAIEMAHLNGLKNFIMTKEA